MNRFISIPVVVVNDKTGERKETKLNVRPSLVAAVYTDPNEKEGNVVVMFRGDCGIRPARTDMPEKEVLALAQLADA